MIVGSLNGTTLTCTETGVGTSGPSFPHVGQFLLKIGNEKLVVVRRAGSSTTNFGVLRGIRNSVGSNTGNVGRPAILSGMPVYPLGDFRFLFQSGLVVF
jgi:hypothetical protein